MTNMTFYTNEKKKVRFLELPSAEKAEIRRRLQEVFDEEMRERFREFRSEYDATHTF